MKKVCTPIRCLPETVRASTFRRLKSGSGFAIMEIILMLVIIGIIGSSTMMLQRSSWKTSGSSNRLLIAGQMIERQIEALRMQVDADPENNFPPEDGTIRENGITLSWQSTPARRTVGTSAEVDNVRKCYLTAQWGDNKNDSVSVTTYLSKNF